jgi:hypothetical protein
MEEPVFRLNEERAERDIYNIGGNLRVISENLSAEDIVDIIEAIRFKVSDMGIDEKEKKRIKNHLDSVKIDLEEKNLDIKSIVENIKIIDDILKIHIKDKNVKGFEILISKIPEWLEKIPN